MSCDVKVGIGLAKQILDSLLERENLSQNIMEVVKVIPWEIDPTSWEFTYVGPHAETVLGYPIKEWYTHNFWKAHVHPEDRWALTFLEAPVRYKKHEFECRMVASDGSIIWLHNSVNAVLEESSPKMLWGFMLDITERKRMEQALRESTERFHKIFDEGPMGIALFKPDYRFVSVNNRLCQMLGYSDQELRVLGFHDITHPADVDEDILKLFSGEIPSFKIQTRLVKKNKETLWTTVTVSVIGDQEGKPQYGLAMIEDQPHPKQENESTRNIGLRLSQREKTSV